MDDAELPPLPSHFTATVAERCFVYRDADGEQPLRVEFGAPQQDAPVVDGTDWRCPVRLTLGAQQTVRSAMGVDSLQALVLAMELARALIGAVARRPHATLRYLDEPVDTAGPDWLRGLI